MRHTFLFAAIVIFAAVAVLTGGALAQQMGDAPAAPPKRLERAAHIVSALEQALTRARAAEVLEGGYIETLEAALVHAHAMTKPVTAAELTDGEKESLRDELGAPAGDDAADGRRPDWAERALGRAFEDAGLTEEQEAEATPIIEDWYAGFLEARAERDSKKQSDLKKERDVALRKLLGRKKAGKVINNLNSLSSWGRGR